MKTLTLTARLMSAAAATVTTIALFSAVVSNSEPQRSVLIAKTHQAETVAAAAKLRGTTSVVAAASTVQDGRAN